MKTFVVTLLALLLAVGTPLAAEPIRLEASNFPGFFVRHQNFRAVLTQLGSDLDYADSSFYMQVGLVQRGQQYVSLQSVNYPGMFLRHKNFQLVLDKNDGSAQFAADASFKVGHPSFSDYRRPESFEASNFPGYFLRHKNFVLVLERNDGSDLFFNDSAFMVTRAPQPTPVK